MPRQRQQPRVRATASHGDRTFNRVARVYAHGPVRAWPRRLRGCVIPVAKGSSGFSEARPVRRRHTSHQNATALLFQSR